MSDSAVGLRSSVSHLYHLNDFELTLLRRADYDELVAPDDTRLTDI